MSEPENDQPPVTADRKTLHRDAWLLPEDFDPQKLQESGLMGVAHVSCAEVKTTKKTAKEIVDEDD